MNYIDFAVAVLMFLVFFSVILILSTNYFTNISGLTRTSEFRTVAEGLYNLFFGGKGIPENWEKTSLSPVQIGLIGDLYRVPVIVRETSGYDRINEIVNVNLIFDSDCKNKSWNNTVRVFDENNNEVYSKIHNQTFCSSQFLKQARVVWETNFTANQIKKFYVYFSSDDSIIPSNYSNTFSTVGYWNFDEGSGNMTYDYTGNNNVGTLENSTHGIPQWRSGNDCKYGYCLEFDGEGDYVEVEDSGSLQFRNELTVGLWFKMNDKTGYDKKFIDKFYERPFSFTWDVSATSFDFMIRNITDTRYTSSYNFDPSLGQWYHIAGTYNGSYIQIYFNGMLRDSIYLGGSVTNTTSSLTIGSGINGVNPFNGTIDEVRIWNRALSPEEINASYISGPLPTKLFPEEKLDTISSTKIEAMKGLNYEEIIKTIGDYRFRIEISERE